MRNERVKRDIEISVVFRGPKYPAIVISRDRLYSATYPKSLVSRLISSNPLESEDHIKIGNVSVLVLEKEKGYLIGEFCRNPTIRRYPNAASDCDNYQCSASL